MSTTRLGEVIPPTPGLELLARFEVELGKPLEVGEVGTGQRRIIPIVGGRFRGPRFNGRVLPGGADWQLVQADGVARIDTRYALQTDDGASVFISTGGIRHGPPEVIAALARGEWVEPSRYYFRVALRFETGAQAYGWLNRAVAIAAAVRLPEAVVYDAFLVT
ncbi:MAG TPA: DUF3237 domain-containing protein [Candidatus Dormibacteraeota bacterium]|nr:DUF3237 domain-containing protein [Candidatus Dormibacteraeota bacterium]